MKKINVLILPCGSEIGMELYKSLSLSTHFGLVGGSSVDDHGKYLFEEYVGDIPFVDNADFMPRLLQVIEEYGIQYIYPAHDSLVLRLAQEKAAGNLPCSVVTSPLPTCEVARSKARTYELFHTVVPTPKVKEVSSLQAADLPVFLKPDVGQGSKGTFKACTLEEVAFHHKQDPTLLALEYLPGKEYTVDCFTDRHGELRYVAGRERARINNGISVNSVRVSDARFRNMAEKLSSKLIFRGAWFYQVKEDASGTLVLMEIAPRIAGTMGLTRAKGVNLALLSLFDAMELDVEIYENRYSVEIDRALINRYKHDIVYTDAYFDFDDLVVLDGKVNPAVMAFVYQCHNKGVRVHLLTRHELDLNESLKKFKLTGAFDELHLVKRGQEKHSFIRESGAIFIDDSNRERRSVHAELGIPVFDAHMIEVLMDK